MSIIIKAIAKQLPVNRYHSTELDDLAKVRRGNIEKHTGVSFRHHVSDNETVCSLGAAALMKALKVADLDVASIDLLIPHNAAIIKSMVADDTVNFHCIDINATCLSFLNALDIANLYLETNRYKRIAIVCSEIASKALTHKEAMVFGLFGDAAVALILDQSTESGYQQVYSDFINYPSGSLLAHVPIGGAVNRGFQADESDLGYYFKMNGKGLFRLTTRYIDEFLAKIEKQLAIKLKDFHQIIPHQTSKMGNQFFLNHFKLRQNKVIETLNEYGNCISASIALGLEKYCNELKQPGQEKILLFGSGAGVSLGAMVLQFDE